MRIRSAAVRDKNGKVYTGKNHGEIDKTIPRDLIRDSEEGFVTDDNRFVSREEAAAIAFEAGQIKEPIARLFSNDLELSP